MAEQIDNPLSFQQVTDIPVAARRRRPLRDILRDTSFDFRNGPVGPSIEDDSAAFDNFLRSGESARRREEGAATDQVLEGLQSRGLARSGIALKDVVAKVLGPSAERAGNLAAQFGLEQARRRSDLLEGERGRAGALNQARLGGRLSAILQEGQGDIGMEENILRGLQDFQNQKLSGSYGLLSSREAQEREDRRASMDRRAGRQNAVVGAAGGLIGGALSAFCFTPETIVLMADGGARRIADLRLGDRTTGGVVLAVNHSYTTDLRNYRDVYVSGGHAVKDGDIWKRVKDAENDPIPGLFEVFTLVTSNHQIIVPTAAGAIVFADDMEVDGGYEMSSEACIEALNASRAIVEA